MAYTYPHFYRDFGINTLGQLHSRIHTIDRLHLPTRSLFHYTPSEPGTGYPDETLPYLNEIPERIPLQHVTLLSALEGKPTRRSFTLQNLVQAFHRLHPKFILALLLKPDMLHGPSPAIINYALLPSLYTYRQQKWDPYFAWKNVELTVQSQVRAFHNTLRKPQLRCIEIPDLLPSVATLRDHGDISKTSFLSYFADTARLQLLDLWNWLGKDRRDQSVLSRYNDDELNQLTFILTYRDRWAALNLGQLQQFRRASPNSGTVSQLPPEQLQKEFLRFLMTVQGGGSDPTAAPPPPVETVPPPPIPGTAAGKSAGTLGTAPAEEPAPSAEEPPGDADPTATLDDELASLADLERIAKGKASSAIKPIHDAAETQPLTKETAMAKLLNQPTIQAQLQTDLEDYAELRALAMPEYTKLKKLLQTAGNYSNPYRPEQSVADFTAIDPAALKFSEARIQLPDHPTVFDKSMLTTKAREFTRQYVETLLPKHTLAMLQQLQRAGFVIKSHEVELDASVLGESELHRVTIQPLDGVANTLQFRIPKVRPEGNFKSAGNLYRMRIQRVDVPIRKISPTTVQLLSYYGKVFVRRSEYRKDDPVAWLSRQLYSLARDAADLRIARIVPGAVFKNTFTAPAIYSGLGKTIRRIEFDTMTLNFDPATRGGSLAPDELERLEENGHYRVVGTTATPGVLLMDYNEVLWDTTAGGKQRLGTLPEILGLDTRKAPLGYAGLSVMGELIPLGFVLAYYLGFEDLLALLEVTPLRLPANKPLRLQEGSWALQFRDQTLVFNRADRLATLTLAGLRQYQAQLKRYAFDSFNDSNVYLNILLGAGLTPRHLRELNLLDRIFIDPITLGELTRMGEPTNFRGLLYRAVTLLLNETHPDTHDRRYQRDRGYERIPGAIYREMVNTIRQYQFRNLRGKTKPELNPYAVQNLIAKDPTVKLEEVINPIQDVKQMEAVTFVGQGGRSKDTLIKTDRIYHETDLGATSEATVDNKDVGVNVFYPGNVKLENLSGRFIPFDPAIDGAASILSTPCLLSPGVDRDDPKRAGFVSIQHSHTVACDGYHQPLVRTGYETLLPYKTSRQFAWVAEEAGKVLKRDSLGIKVEFASGQITGTALGRTYGQAEGTLYPHDIVSGFKTGDTFERGDALAYHQGFFEPDALDPRRIILKTARVVNAVLWEDALVHEDSSAITPALGEKMRSSTTHLVSHTVRFDQAIQLNVAEGSVIEPNDVLFLVQNKLTENLGGLDDDTAKALARLQGYSAKATISGQLDRYEVYYHGDLEDMSPSLRELAERSDKARARRSKAAAEPVYTGRVTGEYRIAGVPLAPDTAEIKVFLTKSTPMGEGDKAVAWHQMKTVTGQVLNYDLTTEDGTVIDLVFGKRSIDNRIVESPFIIGTTLGLLFVAAKEAVKLYYGK